MPRLTWLGWLGVLAVLVACGKAEGGSGPVPREQLSARVAAIACEGLGSCCQSSGFTFDVANCKQLRAAQIDQNLLELDTASVEYDDRAAGECLDALAANSKCGGLDEDGAGACERIFRGTIALGEPCTTHEECREERNQRVRCISDDRLGNGVCTLDEDGIPSRHGEFAEACFTTCFEGDDCSFGSAPVPVPGPGEPAAQPAEPAACYRADGLWCDFGTGSPSCARLVPLGEPCTGYDSCAGEAFCAGDTGVCSAPRANRQPCSADDECQSGSCSFDGPALEPGAPDPIQSYCVEQEILSADQCTVDLEEPSDDAGGSSGDAEAPPARP